MISKISQNSAPQITFWVNALIVLHSSRFYVRAIWIGKTDIGRPVPHGRERMETRKGEPTRKMCTISGVRCYIRAYDRAVGLSTTRPLTTIPPTVTWRTLGYMFPLRHGVHEMDRAKPTAYNIPHYWQWTTYFEFININAECRVNRWNTRYKVPVNVNDDTYTLQRTWRDRWSIHKKVCPRFQCVTHPILWGKHVRLLLWTLHKRPVVMNCNCSVDNNMLNEQLVNCEQEKVICHIVRHYVKDGCTWFRSIYLFTYAVSRVVRM